MMTKSARISDDFNETALVHLADLVRTARRVTRDSVLAEDLVQETYLEAWRSFHNFEPIGTVMSRLNRARRHLREALTERSAAVLVSMACAVVLLAVFAWLTTRERLPTGETPGAIGPSVVTTVQVEVSAAEVWRALTDPALSRQYLFDLAVDSDWRSGSRIVHRTWEGQPYMDGVILEIEPERRLRHSVRMLQDERTAAEAASRVTWSLTPTPTGCEVKLVHDGFASETATYRAASSGWPIAVAGLKELLETGEVQRDPTIGG